MKFIKNYGGSTTEESNSPPQTIKIDSRTAKIGLDWSKFTSKLFVTKDGSDLAVFAGEKEKGEELKEIKLHQLVLESRIPDFANNLKHNLKEKEAKKVEITDFSYDVMNSFFEFAYCGTATNFDELVCELLKVADKYQFIELKELCAEKIAKNINVGNAASICSIAFFAQADELLKKTKEFIMKPENFKACRYETPKKLKKERQSWRNLPHKVLGDILEIECFSPKKRKMDEVGS